MKKVKYILIPVVVTAIFAVTLTGYINNKYNDIIINKDIESLKTSSDIPEKEKGLALKEKLLSYEDINILGSSELNSEVPQNPMYFFNEHKIENDVTFYGRAFVQSLQHATLINTTDSINENEKIALIVSLQWFENIQGVDKQGFIANFSDKQFYKMLNDKSLSKENKKYYAERVSELLHGNSTYSEEQVYAKLYSQDNVISSIALTLLKPYYIVKEKLLDTKDKLQVIRRVKELPNIKEKNNIVEEVNWDKEFEKAEQDAKSKVSNNDLYILDTYYDKYIKNIYEGIEGKLKDVKLLESKEMNDYKLFLDVCKNKGIKPVITITLVNGKYYDHQGLTSDKRQNFYNEIEKLAKEKGFEVVNYGDKDYEKYFLSDVMHLGWKGWLDINHELVNYFNE